MKQVKLIRNFSHTVSSSSTELVHFALLTETISMMGEADNYELLGTDFFVQKKGYLESLQTQLIFNCMLFLRD